MIEKGKLKIFFGYSAGVGKTYAMLKAAQNLKQEGVDIIIGYIEPHDRADTMALTVGLEQVPLKKITYKGITLNEFDVDKAIERKPHIVLVDELAHTNAPGSKNTKRYLDVEELINNGIDVWTTVNVQHIEGLHDLVDEETNVDVNERVPDEIFDLADEVVLIDIEPVDLIERMRQGKVYTKTKAQVALENFFHEDNLASLRELFLRRGADRIERQSFNGALKTKVLVLISPSPSSEKNIYIAARMSEAYHCRFSAMYVERNGDLSDESADRLKEYVKLVKDLGGTMVIKYGEDVVETVSNYVKLAGVTNLVLGKTWSSIGKKVGLEDKFIERIPNVEILIVPDNTRCGYKTSKIKDFFYNIFAPNKIFKKYKMANKTLDIINLISEASMHRHKLEEIARILSMGFNRSCIIYGSKKVTVKYKDEDIDFFKKQNEVAVASWVKKNKKIAGKGSETLRNAGAIYFPIETKLMTVVIGFACHESKMTITDRMIFSQVSNTLCAVL